MSQARTMKQAREAGDYFVLEATEPKRRIDYIAAQTPEEALEFERSNIERGWHSPIPEGTVFDVYLVLPESRIGAMHLEHVGRVTW